MRRVVYTRDLIVFANVGQEVVLDVIPMAEIVSVREIDSEQIPDGDRITNHGMFAISFIALLVISVLTMLIWNVKVVIPRTFQQLVSDVTARIGGKSTIDIFQ